MSTTPLELRRDRAELMQFIRGAGIAQAGHLSGSPVNVIRGHQRHGRWDEEHRRGRLLAAEDGGGTVRNQNSDSGQVGIQAGHVTGSVVYMGVTQRSSPSTDLVLELAELRGLLAREHSAGTIDEATYEAAGAEVDIASHSLPADTPERKNALVLALKRLRGLVFDVTDLATKITALLAAVKGL